jgi:hypothetical protein
MKLRPQNVNKENLTWDLRHQKTSTALFIQQSNNDSQVPNDVSVGFIQLIFDYTDIQGNISLKIGTIPAGAMISRIAIYTSTAFNNSLNCIVGDISAPARLMMSNTSLIISPCNYEMSIDYQYLETTDIYITFNNQLATQGTGKIIVYYS